MKKRAAKAPKKRSTMPPILAFGARLRELRGTTERSRISKKLERLGTPLTQSTLAQYEGGKVWAPDAAVVWGLAQIYQVSFLDLIHLLRTERIRAMGQIRTEGEIPEQKSYISEPLDMPDEDYASSLATAHEVPSRSGHASTKARRAVPRTGAVSEQGLFQAIDELHEIADSLLLGQKALAETLARFEDGGQTSSAGAQPPTRPAPD